MEYAKWQEVIWEGISYLFDISKEYYVLVPTQYALLCMKDKRFFESLWVVQWLSKWLTWEPHLLFLKCSMASQLRNRFRVKTSQPSLGSKLMIQSCETSRDKEPLYNILKRPRQQTVRQVYCTYSFIRDLFSKRRWTTLFDQQSNKRLFKWHIPGLFFYIFIFSVQLRVNKCSLQNFWLLPGLERESSVKWTTNTDHKVECF